jgi:hypothetical protein
MLLPMRTQLGPRQLGVSPIPPPPCTRSVVLVLEFVSLPLRAVYIGLPPAGAQLHQPLDLDSAQFLCHARLTVGAVEVSQTPARHALQHRAAVLEANERGLRVCRVRQNLIGHQLENVGPQNGTTCAPTFRASNRPRCAAI